MSWGERSCKIERCKIATFETCDVDCPDYKWDQTTKPDSEPRNRFKEKTKTKKTGRNDPCPCKSGKKYKKCCGPL